MGMFDSFKLLFPPTPPFTEKDVPSQAGKVFIVTGSSSGVGKELVQILYSHDAKVYVAARSAEKANKAIDEIKAKYPTSKGELVFLSLDLGDLTTIKKSAEEFLSKEDRLDVLWNNAGVMVPPVGEKTAQGYDLQLGTNNVGPFLFTGLLTPILIHTAKSAPKNSVRVVWVSSSAAEVLSPKNGLDINNLDYKKDKSNWERYGVSKAGNWYHATEYAKRHRADGIISVALNPGNLRTDLQRSVPSWQMLILKHILYDAIYGAYTELYAGLSPEVTLEKTGTWIQPWGRMCPIRADLDKGSKSDAEGGTGIAQKFWTWTEEQVKAYL